MDNELEVRPRHCPGLSRQQLTALLEERCDVIKSPDDKNFHDGKKAIFFGVTNDSRKVRSGDIYCALPGANNHGAVFYRQAVAAGACAVVTDREGEKILGKNAAPPQSPDLPLYVVENPRAVIAMLAATLYGTSSWAEGKPLFAVTGTNGKTTTSYFIKSLLAELGRTPGLLGTIEISVGGRAIPSILTTPEAADIHAYISVMAEAGADALSMEVSSHALEFNRVDYMRFDVSGFTNLTQDHLDFHGSMAKYFQSKMRLFVPERTRRAVAVIDGSENCSWAWRLCRHNALSGIGTAVVLPGSDVDIPEETRQSLSRVWKIKDIYTQDCGYRFRLVSEDGQEFGAETALTGLFNVTNAALALAMIIESGFFTAGQIRAALAQKPFNIEVPGRMHRVAEDPVVIIDFAHNSAAMKRVFEVFKEAEDSGRRKRVITVFGATGQRDRLKRPKMGMVAVTYADIVVVTDDDPHGENAQQIRSEVLAGAYRKQEEFMKEGIRREVLEVAPRDRAIEKAVEMARPQDVVLILGRGHEVVQDVAGIDVELDDREVARLAVARKNRSQSFE